MLKILKDKNGLKLPNNRLFIEQTKNKLKLVGDNQPPLDTILNYVKSQPLKGDPDISSLKLKDFTLNQYME